MVWDLGGRKPTFFMKMDLVINKLRKLLIPVVEKKGFRVVRFKIFKDGKPTILQIMIEHKDAYLSFIHGDGGVNAKDCASISYEVSPLLDTLDYLPPNYNLEVSSPGIDRPLMTEKDFDRFTGFEIKLKFIKKFLGKKSFSGKLIFIKGDKLGLNTSNEIIEIDRKNILEAKLVLTSELIEISKKANEKFNKLKKERFCYGKTDG